MVFGQSHAQVDELVIAICIPNPRYSASFTVNLTAELQRILARVGIALGRDHPTERSNHKAVFWLDVLASLLLYTRRKTIARSEGFASIWSFEPKPSGSRRC